MALDSETFISTSTVTFCFDPLGFLVVEVVIDLVLWYLRLDHYFVPAMGVVEHVVQFNRIDAADLQTLLFSHLLRLAVLLTRVPDLGLFENFR